jgi:hypothetical protein
MVVGYIHVCMYVCTSSSVPRYGGALDRMMAVGIGNPVCHRMAAARRSS